MKGGAAHTVPLTNTAVTILRELPRFAVGDYVFAHVNFVNLLTDDPKDTGVAGVDIYKMNTQGKAVEHWDALELVGDPKNSAPWVGPNIPRANPNGMF